MILSLRHLRNACYSPRLIILSISHTMSDEMNPAATPADVTPEVTPTPAPVETTEEAAA